LKSYKGRRCRKARHALA